MSKQESDNITREEMHKTADEAIATTFPKLIKTLEYRVLTAARDGEYHYDTQPVENNVLREMTIEHFKKNKFVITDIDDVDGTFKINW